MADPAIADYDEAIRLNPKNAAAYTGRRAAYAAKGDLDRAIADYGEWIRLDPKNFFAYNNRGAAYLAKGDNDRAIASYSEAIRLNPKFAWAYKGRGLAYLYSGNPANALADVSQASKNLSEECVFRAVGRYRREAQQCPQQSSASDLANRHDGMAGAGHPDVPR
jgi:tetratricopeptide (TPR) repeat protein